MSVYAKIPIVSDSVTREGVSLTVDHIIILESILFVTELLTYILITATTEKPYPRTHAYNCTCS